MGPPGQIRLDGAHSHQFGLQLTAIASPPAPGGGDAQMGPDGQGAPFGQGQGGRDQPLGGQGRLQGGGGGLPGARAQQPAISAFRPEQGPGIGGHHQSGQGAAGRAENPGQPGLEQAHQLPGIVHQGKAGGLAAQMDQQLLPQIGGHYWVQAWGAGSQGTRRPGGCAAGFSSAAGFSLAAGFRVAAAIRAEIHLGQRPWRLSGLWGLWRCW